MAISISWGARWSCGLLAMGLAGCVEPYMPELASAPDSYLVVDGFINGNGRSVFRLSRSVDVAATTVPPVERAAKLVISDNAGGRYPLTEVSAGTYRTDSLVLPASRQYQLTIQTARNIGYASDLVPLRVTPPIDRLSWRLDGDQTQILLDTHDPTAQTRYYRWGFSETWEFTSAYEATVEYDRLQQKVVPRITPTYRCWRTQNGSALRQGTSAQLSQDALLGINLSTILGQDERLAIRYSVLVSQYAETAAEFAYYEVLRKNTEAVGTVNDPLPSQLTGNVHRLSGNTSEPVLGFVGAHTTQSKRLFINRADLPFPRSWRFDSPYRDCQLLDSILIGGFRSGVYLPVYAQGTGGDLFAASTRECVDCRLRGSNIKPSFW